MSNRAVFPARFIPPLILDVALVVLFAALGRSSHSRDATLIGLLETAWPFLAGLVLAWVCCLAWKRPLAVVRTGVPVWLGTVVFGLALRLLSTGRLPELPFVIVATVAMCVFLIGWRGIAMLVRLLGRRSA